MRTILAVLLTLVIVSFAAHAAEDVAIVNQSFEDATAEAKSPAETGWQTGGAPAGWHCWIGSTAKAGNPKLVWEENDGRTGKRSVSLQGCIGGVCVIQSVPVQPKENYFATAWAKTTNPKSVCKLNIRWQTKEGKWANGSSSSDSIPAGAKANEWVELAVPFQAPENAGFAVFLLTADKQESGDKCWFDDVRLQHIGPEDILIGPCGWLHPNCAPMGEPMETPHVKWAKPYAKGKLNVLFVLPNDHNLREQIEVAQRMDIEYDWVFAHDFDTALYGLDNKKIMKRLDEGYYDVAVIATRAMAPMVTGFAKRCKKGVVLVGYRHPAEREEKDGTKKIVWSSMIPEPPKDVKLTEVQQLHLLCEPLDAMPTIPLTGDPSVHKVEVADGEKRIARITWNTRFMCLTPIFEFDDHLRMGGGYWEAYMQILIRAILWTGGKEFASDVVLRANGEAITLAGCETLAERTLLVTDSIDQEYQDAKSMNIPPVAATGPSTVGIRLLSPQGQCIGFAATRIAVKRSPRIAEVRPSQPHFLSTDKATVNVKIEGKVEGMKLIASLTDAFGREHARAEVAAKEGENALTLSVVNRMSNFNWINVRLMNGEKQQDAARWYLLAPLPRKPFMDQFQIGTWACATFMPQYLRPALHQIMKDEELTEGLQSANGYRSMLAGGLWPISTTYSRIPGFSRWDKDETVRKPCLSNPDDRKKMAETAKEIAAEEIGISPLLAYLKDETSLVKDDRDLDVCSCEHCQARYRAWLKERYKSIADLNREWGTSYASFDDAGFITYKEAREKETPAPWVMYRRFMDWTWAEGIDWVKKHAKEGDGGLLVGMPNTFGQNPFSGRDYYELSKVNEYRLEYARETRSPAAGGMFFDAVRSFAPEVRDHPWIGYRFDDETIIFAPWWTAYHGATGFSVYGTLSFFAGKNSWAQIFPTLQHTPRGLLYAKQAKELKEGIGKVLIEGRRVQAPVAILWSQANLYAAWLLSGQTGHPMAKTQKNRYGYYFDSREMFRQAVIGGGRQFDYVVEEQIAAGKLKGYSCLILPAAYALSDETLRTIKTFAESGGTVIADMGVGVANGVGAKRTDQAIVTDLFGIQRKGDLSANLQPEDIEVVDGAVKGEALKFIKKAHGKGKAVFVNTIVEDASALAPLFDGLPRIGEITAPDGTHPKDYELVEFEMGGNRYLGITHHHLNDDPNYETVRIKLPQASEVYDVRARRHLGKTDTIEAVIPPGHAGFYALLGYPVKNVEVSCGEAVACRVNADGDVGDHVVHVDVLRPDGSAHPAYSMNVIAENGLARFNIPFALNDPAGEWTVVCRDVASGVEGKGTLKRNK
ncbi:MAG: beta-galactosidase [Planctomycetota bacterium]